MKCELGDKDELPIALHNLSLTLLISFDASGDLDSLNEAMTSARKGLSWIEKTNSIKKKGHLLAEIYLILKKLDAGGDTDAAKEDLRTWIESCADEKDKSDVQSLLLRLGA